MLFLLGNPQFIAGAGYCSRSIRMMPAARVCTRLRLETVDGIMIYTASFQLRQLRRLYSCLQGRVDVSQSLVLYYC